MADIEEKVDDIDWRLFDSPFVKIGEEPIDLAIKNWVPIVREYQGKNLDGIKVDVIRENGKPVKKEWVITSKPLIRSLKSVIESCEQNNRKEAIIRISRVGTGFQTNYKVREV